jgi:hypothetical protein
MCPDDFFFLGGDEKNHSDLLTDRKIDISPNGKKSKTKGVPVAIDK